MKLIVTGGRDFKDRELLTRVLDHIHVRESRVSVLIHGGAAGADALAAQWAAQRGVLTVEFRAQWQEAGPKAGPLRNKTMLSGNRDALVLAFPGGAGTRDCTTKARKMGMQVRFAVDVLKGLKV